LFGTEAVLTLLRAGDPTPETPQSLALSEILNKHFANVLSTPDLAVDPPPDVGPGTPKFLKWLRKNRFPEPLIQHFSKCSIRRGDVSFMSISFRDEPHMMRIDKYDKTYISGGFFPFADACDGDPIVFDLVERPFQVGFLSHEHLWGVPTRRRQEPLLRRRRGG
jgi:hypothetical protein